jgi:predicted amidohydrolase
VADSRDLRASESAVLRRSGNSGTVVGTSTARPDAGTATLGPEQGVKPKDSAEAEPSSRMVRLGLVQSVSTVGTEMIDPRDENLGRALKAIDGLADDGVQLIVFGEMYLSGYRTDEWLYKWATRLDPPDRHVEALMEVAQRRKVHVIMGAATFGQFMPGEIYNSAIFVGPEGIVGVYRKVHVAAFPYRRDGKVLLATERLFYTPGKEIPVFDTPLGCIGIQICYDAVPPELSRVQALRGAEILINVSANADGFAEYRDHFLFMRAAENASWFAVCSVVGEQRGDKLVGASRIVDPTGDFVAAGKYNEEDLVIADVDLEAARRSRAAFHPFSVRQPELYEPISRPTSYP